MALAALITVLYDTGNPSVWGGSKYPGPYAKPY